MNKYPLNFALLLAIFLFLGQCQKSSEGKMGKLGTTPLPRNEATMQEPKPLAVEGKVPGEYLKAFLVAHTTFAKDSEIQLNKRKIENYWVTFSQTPDSYKVDFFAKRKPSELDLDGGESELGRDVTYLVDKKTYQIVLRQFYK